MDIFGSIDPRKMPAYLFQGAVYLDYSSAIRGNPGKQNYLVCPRHWYLDADFNCERCHVEFTWTAREQKYWFEDYYFWVDSRPRHCKGCVAVRKHLKLLRMEYDSTVRAAHLSSATKEKIRIIEVVCEMESAVVHLPRKMIETKELFERQLRKSQSES